MRSLLVVVLFALNPCGTWHGPGSESCANSTNSGDEAEADMSGAGGFPPDASLGDGGLNDGGLGDGGLNDDASLRDGGLGDGGLNDDAGFGDAGRISGDA